jgi:glycosyltransferase involved in cell wall biosynthesis
MNRPKIAYMLAAFPTLSETFIIREIQAFINRGIDVSIFAIKRPFPIMEEKTLCVPEILCRTYYARPESIRFHLIRNIRAAGAHPVRYFKTLKVFLRQMLCTEPSVFMRTIYHFFCGIGFSKDLQKKGIQHIHSHFTAGTNIALAASLYSRINFSFTAHASGDIFVKPILLEEKMKNVSFVVAVCEYSKKFLDSITGFRYSYKLARIYNGIRIPEPQELLGQDINKTTKRDGSINLISVGRLVDGKGFPNLIATCAILKKRGHNFRCEIIGNGPNKSKLEEIIKKSQMKDTIFIIDYVSIKAAYAALHKADIFILLSEIHTSGYRDGFPTVILEAMLMALPVVSTWISGIPEMVINEKTGLLVHERDSLAAADAIERLIMDKETRAKYGLAGRQRVTELFNLDKNIEEFISLFK